VPEERPEGFTESDTGVAEGPSEPLDGSTCSHAGRVFEAIAKEVGIVAVNWQIIGAGTACPMIKLKFGAQEDVPLIPFTAWVVIAEVLPA